MNTPLFIAKKMSGERRRGARVVRLTSGIVVGSIAISVTVMILALSVVNGFKHEIRKQTAGFSGELLVSAPGAGWFSENMPLSKDISFLPYLTAHSMVRHTQCFVNGQGLLKTEDAIQGILIKGVGPEFDGSFFASCLSEGRLPAWNDSLPSMELLVSKRLASAMRLQLNDPMLVYFIGESVRLRRFVVAGIYDAVLEDLDKSLVIGDIRVMQQLNGWQADQVSGIEFFLHNPRQPERAADALADVVGQYAQEQDAMVSIQTLKEQFPHLYDWFNLIDVNLFIVLALMILVAGVNMFSGLLILLFDKIAAIGLLKALGMKDGEVRKTFLYRAGALVLTGMVSGNVLGLMLCLVQKHFGVFKLDPSNYFVSQVPIHIQGWGILLMNVVAFALIMLLMLLPTMQIAKMQPDKSLKMR
jgi:ABC-type transport system, involved in lipoprotein release, permease component